MKSKEQEEDELIEHPDLNESCPCKSEKKFGSCCGREFQCDCNSKLLAAECCYSAE